MKMNEPTTITTVLWREWAGIPGYPAYLASETGDILSIHKGRSKPMLLRQQTSKDGYKYVWLYKNGQAAKVWVHRAVLSAWIRPGTENEEGRHLNDVPDDNRLENLAWGSRQDNVDDKKRNGGQPVGEKSGTHKLTEAQAVEVRKLYGKMSLREIGRRYGISHTEARRIGIGKKWNFLGGQQNGQHKN